MAHLVDPYYPTSKERCHTVTATESAAGYVVYERDVGTKKRISIENIAARDGVTGQLFIVLGYINLKGRRMPICSAQQGNNTHAWVSTNHAIETRASKIYCRVQAPLQNDTICLVFSIKVLEE